MTRFWVGASTTGVIGSAAEGIRLLEIDEAGHATLGDPVDVGPNPMYLAVHGDLLAIAHEVVGGDLSLWRSHGGQLEQVDRIPIAASSCHIAFDPAGEHLFAAGYREGILSRTKLRAKGVMTTRFSFTGGGPDPVRQTSPHPHQTVVDADYARLLVPDLGTDRIRVIGTDADQHRPQDDIVMHSGAGPRHLLVTEGLAIVANELDRTVSIVDLSNRREVSWVAAEDARMLGMGGLSAIRMLSSDVVLVGDRGLNAISAFRLNRRARELQLIATIPTRGHHPRDIQTTRDERLALCANQESDSISIIELDTRGIPRRLINVIDTPSPACLARMPLKQGGVTHPSH